MTKVVGMATVLGPRPPQESMGPSPIKVEEDEEKDKCRPSLELSRKRFRQSGNQDTLESMGPSTIKAEEEEDKDKGRPSLELSRKSFKQFGYHDTLEQLGPSTVKAEEEEEKDKGRPSLELSRQRFRQFGYHDTPGPREALSQLRVLCCEWLQPEIHTKEQILELLVLEQFLTILPRELQAWVQQHCPESAEEAVTLLEDLEQELDEPGLQVGGRPSDARRPRT